MFNIKKCPICQKFQFQFLEIGSKSPAIDRYKIIGAGIRNAGCKRCGSSDRDRLVFLYLRDVLKIFDRKTHLKILHIAPEKSISKKLKELSNIEYIMGDNFAEGYSYDKNVKKMDLCNLHFIDNYFDLIICNHVLEHIEDDIKAMNEVYRVLKNSGSAILQVPISNIIDRTIENTTIKEPDARKDEFGQFDHVRIYGRDYKDRLKVCGLIVETVGLSSKKEYLKYGLNKEEKLYIGKKIES
jgi:SAM-dependent methyltransferase